MLKRKGEDFEGEERGRGGGEEKRGEYYPVRDSVKANEIPGVGSSKVAQQLERSLSWTLELSADTGQGSPLNVFNLN